MEVEKNIKKSTKATVIIVSTIVLAILLFIYVGIALFFTNRFYLQSYINGINVSGKTIKQVEKVMVDGGEYSLILEGRNKEKDIINGEDISFHYEIGDQIKEARSRQNSFLWVIGLFKKSNLNIDFKANYDEGALKKIFNNLNCIQPNNMEEPKSSALEYKNGKYSIIDEVKGNKVKVDKLYEEVVKALGAMVKSLNLDTIECYENPKFVSTSKEVVEAQKLMNKYVSSQITYTRGDKTVAVLNGEEIHKWLSIDEDFKVIFHEENITDFILALDDSYDTVGKARQFVTTGGSTIEVSGGDYGWIMDNASEIEEVKSLIKEGSIVTREPNYLQSGLTFDSDDIGNTYVEIDLTNQYLWFYVNGGLITEGSIVSGNANTQYATPIGVYNLDYKQLNAVLRGPGYACPVSYWMPFNGDIGIHDATWRSSFGGQIYKGDGSHGCINASYSLAKAIFENITEGTPVICYH